MTHLEYFATKNCHPNWDHHVDLQTGNISIEQFFDQRLLLRQSNGIKIKISREPPIASLESNCENVLSSSEGVADVEFFYFFFDQTEPVVLAKVVIWDIG